MKVKIGDIVYDSNEQPIMLIFEDDDMRIKVGNNISTMLPKAARRWYIEYPDDYDVDDVIEFSKLNQFKTQCPFCSTIERGVNVHMKTCETCLKQKYPIVDLKVENGTLHTQSK